MNEKQARRLRKFFAHERAMGRDKDAQGRKLLSKKKLYRFWKRLNWLEKTSFVRVMARRIDSESVA